MFLHDSMVLAIINFPVTFERHNQICGLLYYAVVTPESTLSYIPVCLLLGLLFLIATL